MKKIVFGFLFICSFLFLSSCITLQPEMLKASKNRVENRIHNLVLLNSEVNATSGKEIKGQNYVYTLVDRELKDNILINEEKAYGNIDISVVYHTAKLHPMSIPLMILTVGSLGTLNLLGLPAEMDKKYLEIDVTIFNNSKKIIKKYNYITKKNEVIGYYRKDINARNVDRWREVIDQFKDDVRRDYQFINQELEKQQ